MWLNNQDYYKDCNLNNDFSEINFVFVFVFVFSFSYSYSCHSLLAFYWTAF